jgi:MoxR-like ATPase
MATSKATSKRKKAAGAVADLQSALSGPGAHLGDIVWVEMAGVDVERDDLRQRFTTAGLPASLVTPDPDAARLEVARVGVSDAVVDALFALRAELEKEGFVASDRRWRKLLRVLQAKAWLEGDAEVDPIHFEVLTHGLWREPQDRVKISGIVAKTASPALAEALEIHDAIMEQVLALPGAGELGTAGRSVVAELKKAVKRVEEIRAGASKAVANRIAGYEGALRKSHQEITERIMREMNLSI